MARKTEVVLADLAIKPEANRFDDHFLDVVGNTFKFDHPKGLAEWLKNAADAYATMGVRDDEQFILLRFTIGQPKSHSEFECIDFVGCTKKDIDDALKIWGSPTAAKKGTKVLTYGGHGNGGKFYMRQMFRKAQMVTYQNGLLNVFGFDEKHRYGFVKGFTDRPMSIDEALSIADIQSLSVPAEVRGRWKKNRKKAGFSVVRGIHPHRFSGRSTINTILDGVRFHPQARRLLRHKRVLMLQHSERWGNRLEAPVVEPKKGFEEPRIIALPSSFSLGGRKVAVRKQGQPKPKLILRTSDLPLTQSRELAALNTIDILGEVGCIGSYRMNDLGFLRHAAETEFIYGECECPFLEDSRLNCVMNDREKLVRNELTDALLAWIRDQVDELAAAIGERRRHEKKSRDLAQSSLFNRILDKWKNKFMALLSTELFGGAGVGDMFGGKGADDKGGGAKIGERNGNGDGDGGLGSDDVGRGDAGKGEQGGSGDERRKVSKFPTVLLSGIDRDPFDTDATGPFECDERHPPVYQRQIDIDRGIYWINTSRPLATKILDHHGSEHPRWREYLFQRYVEIILKQQIYSLQKHEVELTAEKIDSLIDTVTARVHDAAAEDLEQFLFDEHLTGSVATVPGVPGQFRE